MSMMITAKDNDKVKYTKSLLKSKNRNKESKFIIEGYRILTLAIECNAKLDYVFINEDFEKKEEHKELLEVLFEGFKRVEVESSKEKIPTLGLKALMNRGLVKSRLTKKRF